MEDTGSCTMKLLLTELLSKTSRDAHWIVKLQIWLDFFLQIRNSELSKCKAQSKESFNH